MATILIVDDQPDNVYILDRLLKGQGHTVLTADRGQLALDIARHDHPDLVLLDVMMPDMDGFEVLRRLRQEQEIQTIPVILLTANAPDERLKIQGLNLGADEYLTQPINNGELLARINGLLRAKQAQDELLAANTQLRALLDLIQASTSTLDLTEVGQHLVHGALKAATMDAGGIWLLETGTLTRLTEIGYAASGAGARHTPGWSKGSKLEQAIAKQRMVSGSPTDIYGASHPYGADLKFVIVLPLLQRGSVVGVLQLGTRRLHQLAEQDTAFLSAMASAAAASLQNARLFAETDRQRRQLEALDNEKDEFISIISHELKNPLASIEGYAGLMSRRARSDPALASATRGLDVIGQQVNRMTMLLDQLRDVSHIGINRFAIEPQPIDLVALVEHVVAGVRTTTAEHTLTVEVGEAPLIVDGDEFRLDQVISNLVGNAIKYSPDGGPIEVIVGRGAQVASGGKTTVPPDWVVVTVRDFGLGIPAKGRERLFERFFRAENAKGRVSGMGLGLYIAREIIHRHGGRMWVESEEGAGSLFGIALPPGPGPVGR